MIWVLVVAVFVLGTHVSSEIKTLQGMSKFEIKLLCEMSWVSLGIWLIVLILAAGYKK